MSANYSLHITTAYRRINSHSIFNLVAQEFAVSAHHVSSEQTENEQSMLP
jgi:hypothetical protein